MLEGRNSLSPILVSRALLPPEDLRPFAFTPPDDDLTPDDDVRSGVELAPDSLLPSTDLPSLLPFGDGVPGLEDDAEDDDEDEGNSEGEGSDDEEESG